MKAETRLQTVRALCVALMGAAAFALAAVGVPAGYIFLVVPAIQLPRWLVPNVRARRALRRTPQAYADAVVSLSYPEGWSARARDDGATHIVSLTERGASVRIHVHHGRGKRATPEALIDTFVSQLLGAMKVHEVTRSEATLAGAPAGGARAVVSRWNDAAIARVLAARLPGGRVVAVHALVPLGTPEGLVDLFLRDLRVL